MKKNKQKSKNPIWINSVVQLFAVGAAGFVEIIVWVPKFWFRNIFFIDREVGPFVWFVLLILLPAFPAVMLGSAFGEAVLRMDDYCKSKERM